MKKIEREVRKLLEGNNVYAPPVSVHHIAENLGAMLSYEPFEGQDEMSGMLYRKGDITIIGINESHHPNRQRFSIAHEIGHLVLHESKDLFVDKVVRVNFRDSRSSLAIDSEEIAANAFAAELLMPKEFIKKEIIKLLSRKSILSKTDLVKGLSRIFEVSPSAMEYRLNNLGVLVNPGNDNEM